MYLNVEFLDSSEFHAGMWLCENAQAHRLPPFPFNLFFYHILCVDTPACKLCPHLQQRATFTPRDVYKAMQLALRRVSVGRRTPKVLRVGPGYLEHCLEVGA